MDVLLCEMAPFILLMRWPKNFEMPLADGKIAKVFRLSSHPWKRISTCIQGETSFGSGPHLKSLRKFFQPACPRCDA
jgi:hypothetical protein